MSTPIVVLSSGGKDSLYMLDVLRRDPAWRVAALLTTVNETNGRVAMHGIPESLLRAQASCLGLELSIVPLPDGCDDETYQVRLAEGLATFRARGVDTVACGDLFLEDIRDWRVRSFERMGWQAVFPVWGTDTGVLALELAGPDWDILVTCVDLDRLPRSFLGRRYDRTLLQDLPDGVDPCGENGEMHTFVCRGPGFQRSLKVAPGRVVVSHGRFAMTDLEAV